MPVGAAFWIIPMCATNSTNHRLLHPSPIKSG